MCCLLGRHCRTAAAAVQIAFSIPHRCLPLPVPCFFAGTYILMFEGAIACANGCICVLWSGELPGTLLLLLYRVKPASCACVVYACVFRCMLCPCQCTFCRRPGLGTDTAHLWLVDYYSSK